MGECILYGPHISMCTRCNGFDDTLVSNFGVIWSLMYWCFLLPLLVNDNVGIYHVNAVDGVGREVGLGIIGYGMTWETRGSVLRLAISGIGSFW